MTCRSRCRPPDALRPSRECDGADRPLHAARAPVAEAYAVALVTAALAFENPLVLARSRSPARRCSPGGTTAVAGSAHAVPFALLIVLVNPLVADEGLTVLLRLARSGRSAMSASRWKG